MAPIRSRSPLPRAPLALLAGALAALAAGCSKSPTSTGPPGDNTGEHLVAFVSDRGRAAGDLGLALYDLDQGGFRSLANSDAPGSESQPCVSNDGSFVAFVATRGSTGSDVFVYDRLQQALIITPGLDTAQDEDWPRFTYDSAKLAFVRRLATGERRVRLYEPQGDSLVPLPGLDAPAGFNDDQPAPNLDGSRIAFTSDRAGNPDVLVWNRAGGIAGIAVLASAGVDTEPSLSANGRWLAFASDRAGGAGGLDVYLYDTVADSLVSLPGLNSAGDDRHPSVSANGDVLVFQSDRAGGGGQFDLYHYALGNNAVDQPGAFRDASNDIQPYLRWR